jgi:hypothetical protein
MYQHVMSPSSFGGVQLECWRSLFAPPVLTDDPKDRQSVLLFLAERLLLGANGEESGYGSVFRRSFVAKNSRFFRRRRFNFILDYAVI